MDLVKDSAIRQLQYYLCTLQVGLLWNCCLCPLGLQKTIRGSVCSLPQVGGTDGRS